MERDKMTKAFKCNCLEIVIYNGETIWNKKKEILTVKATLLVH